MTGFPKPKTIKDRKLLDIIKMQNCVVCGDWPSDPDHIQTVGSGGGDTISNLWPLCRVHHSERHQIGFQTFLEKYPQAKAFLIRLKKI